MSSKRMDDSVSELYNLVSKLDQRGPNDDGFVEEIVLESDAVAPLAAPVKLQPIANPAASSVPTQPTVSAQPSVSKPHQSQPVLGNSGIFNGLFSIQGELTRTEFVKRIGAAFLLIVCVTALAENRQISQNWIPFVSVVVALFSMNCAVKRARHIGINTWLVLCLLIPYINIIAALILLFAPKRKTP